MLDLMRKHAKSWVVSVIIALIAVVFIFWGAGSFRKQQSSKVASVNGDIIGVAEYQESYRRLVEMTKAQFGEGLNEEILKMLNLKQQALDTLITQRLIVQQAKALGIDVLAQDLQKDIAATPIFQVDGRFSPQRYQAMLSRLHYSPAQYEEMMRQEMVYRKVTRLVTSLAKVSPAEALDQYHSAKDQIDLDFAYFAPETFRGQVKFTPEDIQAYFERNKEKYRVPAMAQVAFLGFKAKDFEGAVQIKDEEIAEYYELHADKYREPEKVRARHILLKLDSKATPEETAKVKAKAEELLAKVKAPGADFAKLAQEYSQDGSAAQGGDLDWFSRDMMVAPFSEAAFKLADGQISDLIRTQFGLHIIKTEERKPAKTRLLDEAKAEIKDKLIKDRAGEAALDQAEKMAQEASLTQNLEAVAKKAGLPVQTTGFFAADQTLSDLGLDQRFAAAALALKKGEISPLVNQESGHYLIKCLDRQEPRLPSLDEAKAKVEEDFILEKTDQLAKDAAAAFLAKAEKEVGWDKAATDLKAAQNPIKETSIGEASSSKSQPPAPAAPATSSKPVLDTTGPFDREGRIPKIGGGPSVIEAVFSLNPVGKIYPQPVKGEGGYYAVRLKDCIPASAADFEKNKEAFVQRLLSNKGQNYLYEWLKALKAAAKIEVEEGVL